MLLYHFTTARNALLIGLGNGLTPGIYSDSERGEIGDGWQTMGRPVVWLTKEESNVLTAEHMAHFEKVGHQSETKIGETMYGGPVRCAVEIERSRNVMRWAEFLRTTDIMGTREDGKLLTGRDVLASARATSSMIEKWWLCFKDIPASKIWVPLTREEAVAGAVDLASDHPNAEGRQQWQAQADDFASAPDGTILLFHNGEAHQTKAERAA